jgi:hypothetical protein
MLIISIKVHYGSCYFQMNTFLGAPSDEVGVL